MWMAEAYDHVTASLSACPAYLLPLLTAGMQAHAPELQGGSLLALIRSGGPPAPRGIRNLACLPEHLLLPMPAQGLLLLDALEVGAADGMVAGLRAYCSAFQQGVSAGPVPTLLDLSQLEERVLSVWPADRHAEYVREYDRIAKQLQPLFTPEACSMSPFLLSVPQTQQESRYERPYCCSWVHTLPGPV